MFGLRGQARWLRRYELIALIIERSSNALYDYRDSTPNIFFLGGTWSVIAARNSHTRYR